MLFDSIADELLILEPPRVATKIKAKVSAVSTDQVMYDDIQYKPSLPGIIAIRCEKGEGTASTETAEEDREKQCEGEIQ